MNWLSVIRRTRIGKSYIGFSGFKVSILAIVALASIAYLLAIMRVHPLRWPLLLYILTFWLNDSRWIKAVPICVAVYLLFTRDVGKRRYYRYARQPSTQPKEVDTERARIARYFRLTAVCVFVAWPCVYLHLNDWWPSIYHVAAVSLAIAYYALRLIGSETDRYVDRLGTLTVDAKNFNSAAKNPFCPEITAVAARCSFLCNGTDAESRRVLEATTTDLISNIAQLVDVSPEGVTLHQRTTTAVETALQEAIVLHRQRKATFPITVFTTDNEYRTVREVMLRLERMNACLYSAFPIKDRVWLPNGRASLWSPLVDAICDERPEVVVMSHVLYCPAAILDVGLIIEEVRRRGVTDVIYIIDGAQSIGNIYVDKGIFDLADYYAGCGHKWLLGTPDVGFLVRNISGLRARWGLTDLVESEVPDSSCREEATKTGVTIAYEPRFALNFALEEELLRIDMKQIGDHNHRLALLLRNGLRGIGMGACRADGSVVSAIWQRGKEVRESLEQRGYKIEHFEIEYAREMKTVLRFSCHYYHSQYDVMELIDAVERACRGVFATDAAAGR